MCFQNKTWVCCTVLRLPWPHLPWNSSPVQGQSSPGHHAPVGLPFCASSPQRSPTFTPQQDTCLPFPLAYLTSSLRQLFLYNLLSLSYLTLPSIWGCSFSESSNYCHTAEYLNPTHAQGGKAMPQLRAGHSRQSRFRDQHGARQEQICSTEVVADRKKAQWLREQKTLWNHGGDQCWRFKMIQLPLFYPKRWSYQPVLFFSPSNVSNYVKHQAH